MLWLKINVIWRWAAHVRFGSFFQLLPGLDIAVLLLVYGFPNTLLGFALSYAQLRPVHCKRTREALVLREAQATDIQKQVRIQPMQSLKWDSCLVRTALAFSYRHVEAVPP